MAIIANTYETFQAAPAIREDLSDIMANIAPTDTPFYSGIRTGTAEATFSEFETDTLAAAASNAQLEGDEATFTAALVPQRLGNRTQISRKTVLLSGSNQAVNSVANAATLSYQVAKMLEELKRDIEVGLTQNAAVRAGVSNTTARLSGGFETWVSTNVSLGATGAVTAKTSGQPNNAAVPTDGTQRVFDEEDLKTVCGACFNQGGQPTQLMVGVFNKRAVSGFTGNATRMINAVDKRLSTSIDVYASDFQELTVVPNRFSRDRTAMLVDPRYWELAWLRRPSQVPLAKTGDADKVMVVCEWTLLSRQEAASGKVADLTTS